MPKNCKQDPASGSETTACEQARHRGSDTAFARLRGARVRPLSAAIFLLVSASSASLPLLLPATSAASEPPIAVSPNQNNPPANAFDLASPLPPGAPSVSTTASASPEAELAALELDLELDSPEALLSALRQDPRPLKRARETGSTMLFAYGHALRGSGNLEEATLVLQDYYDKGGLLAPYAALLLGELHLELRRELDAERWFGIAMNTLPAGEPQVQARFGLARGLLARKEAALAVESLEALLKDAPKSDQRHDMRFTLGQAYAQNGQHEKAIETMEWLWSRVPTSTAAEHATRELARYQEERLAGYSGATSVVRYRRARNLLGSGQVETGLSLMLALAQDPAVVATLPRRFAFELARAYFQAKQYTEAAEQLDAWYPRTSGSERAEALYWRALTQGRLGRFDEAVSLYQQLARAYPSSKYAARALYKVGLLRLDEGRYREAETAFAGYRSRYPKSGDADNAVWYVAWCQLRQAHYEDALASYADLLKRWPRSSLVPGVRYWQGRIEQTRGHPDDAVRYFRAVLAHGTASHYIPLAELQLEALGSTVTLRRSGAPPELPPTLELPDPERLSRITALVGLGLRHWAQHEIAFYEHRLKSRDERLAMAAWYQKTGNFYAARRVVANLGLGEGVPDVQDPGLSWKFSYPMAFRDYLARVELPESVPLELLYAIMRQESEFQPWATSPVGARGLMQVMPETANQVCRDRRTATPAVKKLYRPELSVLYGAWHLEDLMKRLDGRLPLVIAAYNAGPEAVERWMKERPVDPIDVFMEEISYSETRRYVRKVLTNLWTYRRVYADGSTPLRGEPRLQLPIHAAQRPSATAGAGSPTSPASEDIEEPEAEEP